MQKDEAVAPAGTTGSDRGVTSEGGRPAAARVSLPDVTLPVDNLDEALPHLRRPFSAAAIKFKVQTVWPKGQEPKGAIIVSYIDARLVIERLNAVVGGRWSAEYGAVGGNDKLLRCDLTVCGVTRRDVGESSKKMSKDLISDALKRSAVHFGVGVSVYALPQISLRTGQPHVERREVWDNAAKAKKPTLVLTDLGHKKLHEGYEKWLEETGARLFGDPLDHGDVVSEIVPDAEMEAEEFVPPAPPALEDDAAVALQERAKALYAEIAKDEAGRRALPPARFDAWLRQSSHSHEALEQLVAHLEPRVGGEAP